MGMYVGLISLTDGSIEAILADPPLIWKVLAPDDDEAYANAREEYGSKDRSSPKPAIDVSAGLGLELSAHEGVSTDLDKAWHGIHYLLTGSAWEGRPPLNFIIGGGRPVDSSDTGYGPARLFTNAQTKEIESALGTLTDDELKARFDPADMMRLDIYPNIWDRNPEEDDTLGYLIEYVVTLRGFLKQTTGAGLGMVVSLG